MFKFHAEQRRNARLLKYAAFIAHCGIYIRKVFVIDSFLDPTLIRDCIIFVFFSIGGWHDGCKCDGFRFANGEVVVGACFVVGNSEEGPSGVVEDG